MINQSQNQILTPRNTGAAVAPPPIVYLFKENFEAPGFENSWTISGGGSANPADTGNVIDGAYSLRLTNAILAFTDISNLGNVYVGVKFNIIAGPTVNALLLTLRSTTVVQTTVSIENAGHFLRVQPVGGTLVACAAATPTATVVWLWVEYEKGSGANATTRIFWSTTGIKPVIGASTTAISTNGTGTADVNRLYLQYTGTGQIVYDTIRVLGSPIGSNFS